MATPECRKKLLEEYNRLNELVKDRRELKYSLIDPYHY